MCYSGLGHTLVSRMILFSRINSYTLILYCIMYTNVYTLQPYGKSFFPNYISAWNDFARDIAEANTFDIFKSILQN